MELPVPDLVPEREREAPLVALERLVDDDESVVEPRRAQYVVLAETRAQVRHLQRQLEHAFDDGVDRDGWARRRSLPLRVAAQQLLRRALDLRVGEVWDLEGHSALS